MEDFDFDKFYADKMRRINAPDHSEEDWEHLTSRLDGQERRRWRVLPLWWLGSLSGLLLCSNIGWWWAWQRSEQKLDIVQTRLAKQEQAGTMATIRRDTIFEKVVVYQYDTVYRTVVFRSTPGGSSSGQQAFPAPSPSLPQAASNVIMSKKTSTDLAQPAQADAGNMLHSTGVSGTQGRSEMADFDKLPSKKIPAVASIRHLNLPENDLVCTPLPPEPGLPLLIPRKIRLGMGAGVAFPSTNGFERRGGWSTSVLGEFAFSDRLALAIEGGYAALTFRGVRYDETLGLPPLAPPSDDYDLKYFETHDGFKPVLHLSVGMRYWWRSQHRLSPFLGVGYAAQWNPGFELEIEYINRVSGLEQSASYAVPATRKPVSLLDVNIGLRRRFSKNWNWQTGVSHQLKLDAAQAGIPRFWAIRSAVLYEF
jgi:hypothetical protein